MTRYMPRHAARARHRAPVDWPWIIATTLAPIAALSVAVALAYVMAVFW